MFSGYSSCLECGRFWFDPQYHICSVSQSLPGVSPEHQGKCHPVPVREQASGSGIRDHNSIQCILPPFTSPASSPLLPPLPPLPLSLLLPLPPPPLPLPLFYAPSQLFFKKHEIIFSAALGIWKVWVTCRCGVEIAPNRCGRA